MTVRETFELDWSQALRGADQIDRALSQASSRFHSSISNALSQLNATVKVSADATALTGSVDAALQNANTNVEVTAEAAPVTGAIDAAVENADTSVQITADTTELNQSLETATGNASALGGSLLSAGGALKGLASGAAGAAIGAFLGSAIGAASDLNESLSKSRVVFQDASKAVEAFAENSARGVGLSKQAALEALGTFGNLFNALGSTRDAAAEMSIKTVQLAADLASFNNLGVDETLLRLRSGLVGEVEPLRGLGISFNAAAVDAKVLQLGLQGANGEISEGAKVQARLQLITEQSGNAMGDFARTSDGLANTQRIVSAEFENLKAKIGAELLPAFLAALKAVEPLISVLSELSTKIAGPVLRSFTQMIDGLKVIGDSIERVKSIIPGLGTDFGGAFGEAEKKTKTFTQQLNEFSKQAGEVSGGKLVKMFEDLQRAQDAPIRAQGGFNTQLAVFKQVAEASIPAAKQLRAEILLQGGDISKLDPILDKAIAKQNLHAQSQDRVTAAMQAQADAAAEEAARLNEMVAATDALASGQLTLEDALFHVEDAQKDLTKAQEEGDPGVIARKVNDLEQAYITGSVAVREHAVATSEFKDEAAKAAAGTAAQISYLGTLAASLEPGSPLRVFLEGYIGDLKKTEGTFVSTVRVDASNALFVLQQLHDLGGFNLDPFSFVVNPDNGFAAGGYIDGPIGAPRVILAHGGERVLTPEQQRQGGGGGIGPINVTVTGVSDPAVAFAAGQEVGRGIAMELRQTVMTIGAL